MRLFTPTNGEDANANAFQIPILPQIWQGTRLYRVRNSLIGGPGLIYCGRDHALSK